MPKGLIVYFSQGGTNARIAEAVGAGLLRSGFSTELWNLKDGDPPDPADFDVLGIGSPTYYYRPPFNVIDYLTRLSNLKNLATFVFVVHGTYRGNTGSCILKALARTGAKGVGYLHCYGEAYFLGYLKEGYLFSPNHPTKKEIARAEAFGEKIAARLQGEPYTGPKADPILPFIYRLERFLTHRFFVTQIYSRLFTVDDRCTPDCDVCVEQCPTGNVRRGEDGRITWGRNCLLCLSCEMKCPEDAVTSPASWSIFKPFMRYNTSHGSRDSMLDHVRVVHKRGQTRRL